MAKQVIFQNWMLIITVQFGIHPCSVIQPVPSGGFFLRFTTKLPPFWSPAEQFLFTSHLSRAVIFLSFF